LSPYILSVILAWLAPNTACRLHAAAACAGAPYSRDQVPTVSCEDGCSTLERIIFGLCMDFHRLLWKDALGWYRQVGSTSCSLLLQWRLVLEVGFCTMAVKWPEDRLLPEEVARPACACSTVRRASNPGRFNSRFLWKFLLFTRIDEYNRSLPKVT